ncbi:branched-chain amino acid aminotransferase [Amycolatopsis sp. lyj-23]|uniref:branched-chain amino acid aminotransferase n=1 Tax=Amycolatopsis sp. lyj-23 TaxID=2789283 RepID=UPI00397A7397
MTLAPGLTEPLRLPFAGDVALAPGAPAPAFGAAFTAHMVTAAWSEATGWQALELGPRRPLAVDPAMAALHYGQAIIEGLKAYRRDDGSLVVFRPGAYARRLIASARRMALPELPEEVFLSAVEQLVEADGPRLPSRPGFGLYLRPAQFATEPSLALRPARDCLFLLVAFVTGGFFGDRPEPIAVTANEEYVRAAPGGTGAAKCAGNYAPTYPAQLAAAADGYQQVLWLDAIERTYVEELGGMNVFFVHRDRRGGRAVVSTPPLTGTLLPGVTRASLLDLAADHGFAVREEPMSIDGWRSGCLDGTIAEAFACGTAAGVTPIGRVRAGGREWTVGNGAAGPVTLTLHRALHDVHRGVRPDRFGWLHEVGVHRSAAR